MNAQNITTLKIYINKFLLTLLISFTVYQSLVVVCYMLGQIIGCMWTAFYGQKE